MIARFAIDAVDGFFHRGGKVVADKVTTIRRVPHEDRHDNWSRLEIALAKASTNGWKGRDQGRAMNLISRQIAVEQVLSPADQGLTA